MCNGLLINYIVYSVILHVDFYKLIRLNKVKTTLFIIY